jgi:hypothetical protein
LCYCHFCFFLNSIKYLITSRRIKNSFNPFHLEDFSTWVVIFFPFSRFYLLHFLSLFCSSTSLLLSFIGSKFFLLFYYWNVFFFFSQFFFYGFGIIIVYQKFFDSTSFEQ